MNDVHILCSHAGCRQTLTIDVRHVANFEGRAWYCRRHEDRGERGVRAA